MNLYHFYMIKYKDFRKRNEIEFSVNLYAIGRTETEALEEITRLWPNNQSTYECNVFKCNGYIN